MGRKKKVEEKEVAEKKVTQKEEKSSRNSKYGQPIGKKFGNQEAKPKFQGGVEKPPIIK